LKYPASDGSPYILSRLSEVSNSLGKKSESESYAARLGTEYPDSPQAAEIARSPAALIQASSPGRAAGQFGIEQTVFFTVQVGSFSKERNARGLLRDLERARHDAYIEKDETGRRYRVRVGRFTTKEEARMMELRLIREGYPTKIFP
jgi:cell division septation protein DedD